MYKFLVAFVLLTPLIGIYLVETGEFSPTIGVEGYDTGATAAYAAYAAMVAVVGWLSARRPSRARHVGATRPVEPAEFVRFATRLLFFDGAFLLLFLFAFGAIDIWVGSTDKGVFRGELGPFGPFPFLMQKFIIPCLLGYATLLYKRLPPAPRLRNLWLANMCLASLIGASWGFKSSAITILVIPLMLLHWRLSYGTLAKLSILFALMVAAGFQLFDARGYDDADIFGFLLTRVTVLQGDVSWHVWSQYIDGAQFPAYWRTPLAAIGDKTLGLFGVEKANLSQWMLYHYDWVITYVAGSPLEHIADDGFNVTATPFSEGLIAGGVAGVLCLATLGGVLVGKFYRFIDDALTAGNNTHAALGATYFSCCIFPWLNGGGIVVLFHISLLVGFGLTLVALRALKAKMPRARRTPKPTLRSV